MVYIVCDLMGDIYAVCDFEHQAHSVKTRYEKILHIKLKIKRMKVATPDEQ